MFKRIVLAADNLDHAKKAAQMAGNAARTMGSSDLCIVVTYPTIPEYLGTPETQRAAAERMAQAEAVASCLRDEVGHIPGRIHTEVLEGSVAEAALAVTEVRGGDLIVMGSKGPGLLGRFKAWLDKVRIVGNAPCPVMIVR